MRPMKLRALAGIVGIAGLVVTLSGARAAEAQSSGPGQGKMWKLTIVSGGLEQSKLGKTGDARSLAALSDLACYSLPGLREVGGLCGGSGALPAGAAEVDPFVRVTFGKNVVQTYSVPGTLTPRWEYAVVIDPADAAKITSLKFELLDQVAPGKEKSLGAQTVTGKEVFKPGQRTLKKVGPHEITYQVDPIDTTPRSYAFKVPANEQMSDLAKNAQTDGPGYIVVPVAVGEEVEVKASGKVQPNAKKYPDRVAGPKGIPTISTKIQFNQPGFRGCEGCDHAALIAVVGGQNMVIGEGKTFTVENSGLLVLAINDLKVVDNAGAFSVEIKVTPKKKSAGAAGAEEPAMSGTTAKAKVADAMTARVIQIEVDKHGAELDACAAAAPNPYGEIVLSFTISASGVPLGVIVEKSSPNLKEAGECMRKKALVWKFPPPRGVIQARYPLSFSAS